MATPQAVADKLVQLQYKAVRTLRQRRGTWQTGTPAHVEYQRRPLDWIVEKLGIPEHTIRWSMNPGYEGRSWDGDRDPLITMLEGLANGNDVGVESGTGTGKTFTAACATLFFLACFENSLVITSAPRGENLLNQIWREIGLLFPRFKRHFPDAELLSGKLRMRPEEGKKESWVATTFVCGVGADEEAAQKAAGFHNPHMLIITEDTPGIDSAIMNAFEHTRTDDHNLQLSLGNPDHRNDTLHRFCFDLEENPRPGVIPIRISALDHPNIVTGTTVVPGAIGKRRLVQREARYGKGTRLYQSRIRGISPTEAENALIHWDWCLRAAAKYDDPAFRRGALALGADVADAPEGDPAAIARFQGACCTEVESFQVKDASEVGERIYHEAMDVKSPVDPRYIGIDNIGVGASAVNTMRRLGLTVRWISAGMRAVPGIDKDDLWSVTETDLEGKIRPAGPVVVEAEQFDLIRSQVWWRAREDLRLGRVALPLDEELFQELCTPTYTTRGGKIVVESKEAIIKRLRRSPNKADAFCAGNFVRPRRRLPDEDNTEDRKANRNRETHLEQMMQRHARREARRKREFERRLRRLRKETR